MTRVHTLSLSDLERLADNEAETPAPRLALAGGSDRRPPDDTPPRGTIIEFPRERARPPEPTAAPAESPLWPAWMAHVLTRYRPPHGSEGGSGHPTGVFI